MKRNWLTRTLVVLMTLAMVVGVLAIKPREAKAALTTIDRVSGEKALNITASTANPTTTLTAVFANTAGDPYSLVWDITDSSVAEIVSSSEKQAVIRGKSVGETDWSVTLKDGAGTVIDTFGSADTGYAKITVTQPSTISVDPKSQTLYYGGSGVTITAYPFPSTAGVAWTTSGTASYTKSENGNSITISPESTGAEGKVTVTATSNATGNPTATSEITINLQDPALTLNTDKVTLEKATGSTTTYGLSASRNGSGTINYSSNNVGVATVDPTTGLITAVAPGEATITVTVSPNGAYKGATKTCAVTVKNYVTLSLSPSTTTIALNSSNSSLKASNSSGIPSNLRVSTNNSLVSASLGTDGTIYLTSGGTSGKTVVTVTSTDSTRSVTATVTVGDPTPTIKAYFDPDNYNLNKSTGYITLHIEVTNPKANYVTIKRSNIRTYATGYDTHESTYYYTHYLDTDGHARFYIHPQYNGTTYYTVSASGASSVQTHNLTISGYTTMPQTGPDYTWVYILSGLCVAALAAAVTLNARKKKHQEN